MFEERIGPFPPELNVRIEWRIRVGDVIAPGNIVAIVETDTVTQELEAFRAGRLVAIVAANGGYLLQMEELSE